MSDFYLSKPNSLAVCDFTGDEHLVPIIEDFPGVDAVAHTPEEDGTWWVYLNKGANVHDVRERLLAALEDAASEEK